MLPGVNLSTELQVCLKEFNGSGDRDSREWWMCRSLRGLSWDVPGAAREASSTCSRVGESQSNAPRACHHRIIPTGNQDTCLVPRRESQALLDALRSALDPVVVLSPRAVTIHPVAQVREVWLCFRGRAFARGDDVRTFLGCPDARDELRPSSLPALKHLLQQL
jgi:hypothetical protein